MALMVVAGSTGLARAQDITDTIPANASANTYREGDGACNAIQVPKHGYLSGQSFGTGWKCDRGYQESQATCIAVQLPENAHLNFAGNDWECNKPYRKRQNKCISADRDE
jgi:hypothetical protein